VENVIGESSIMSGLMDSGNNSMCLRSPVALRNHPKLEYRQHPAWPPQWVASNGAQTLFATGEDGTLDHVEVRRPDVSLPERLVLVINREAEIYIGVLLVNDPALVPKLYDLLKACCGRPLREIGDLPFSESLMDLAARNS
jgi:hypothetical protein